MDTKVYFLGGTSPIGFQSKFIEQIKKPGYYTYILKGGPGTGKSTLMKKIAKEFEGGPVSIYYCSSDLNSLDAVVLEDKKIIVVDGTAPHVFEALYPAVSQEVINLGEYWDKKKMQEHTEAVRYCFDENQKYHNRVRCYVEAFSSLNTDIYNLAEDCLNKEKLEAYISRLSRKLIPKTKAEQYGSIEFKQLSAFTTENYKTHSVTGDYSKYFINDDLFAGGDYFLKTLAGLFTECGYDVTVSECTMLHSSTFEHMIVEKLGLAFITGNFFNKLEYDNENVINFSRFYDKDMLSSRKQRISFDKKASLELSSEAAASLKTALDIHDELEKYYIDAIDFERLNKMTEDFINMLKNS